jgi:hypothetical protein
MLPPAFALVLHIFCVKLSYKMHFRDNLPFHGIKNFTQNDSHVSEKVLFFVRKLWKVNSC